MSGYWSKIVVFERGVSNFDRKV